MLLKHSHCHNRAVPVCVLLNTVIVITEPCLSACYSNTVIVIIEPCLSACYSNTVIDTIEPCLSTCYSNIVIVIIEPCLSARYSNMSIWNDRDSHAYIYLFWIGIIQRWFKGSLKIKKKKFAKPNPKLGPWDSVMACKAAPRAAQKWGIGGISSIWF